ncbi:nucleoside triphosphate pyrophosphohydrolase [Fuchsiella alkaliacetigena]|uniref:nucleoside triphosphate pyrophosphohydrolase n=1 Tax=Fuchsiella alkaliacetigena TaxID=957042 RepID=UPI00200A8BA5|nr:nucleoside triphosphate pyrophosphohydrolase [Fuchsiella alkaliacetigena]MCK8825399.1 nucleoside triphosphate pyrophosphohydrolase [Fuchsiella alkaliacetigena]
MEEYDKLIRDRIPEIIEEAGKDYEVEIMEEQEYRQYLKMKLMEEVKEYNESGEIEELADLLEVIYAILDSEGVSFAELESMRQEKAEQRGSFEKKLKLLRVYE